MHSFATNKQMISETSKTLNVLYVFSGTYEPYLIYWLFPLQMAFKQIMPTAEHPYELAMYLHFLHQNLFPSWTEIFAMAEWMMSLLEREDTEFFTHLQQCFRKNFAVEPKDFLVELIVREREKAQELYTATDRSEQNKHLTKELLASPVIFLRKWMGEGFVSILDFPAVLLIWDQMYMQDWNQKVMENFCLSILMLLKDSLMAANDYPAIREVFLFHGCHLLTADIQRAWIHLQQGGLPADIPGLSRQNQRPLADLSPRPSSMEAGKVSLGFQDILPVGVKDVLLKLVLPVPQVEISHTETWLKEFDPLAVELTVSVFYGLEKLHSKASSFKPSLVKKTKGKTAKKSETTEFTVQFNETFAFDSLDPSEFINMAEAKPYIVLKVVYKSKGKDSLTLGWQMVDVFQQETTNIGAIWIPKVFSTLVPLHPGKLPYNVMDYTLKHVSKGNSVIRVFDDDGKLNVGGFQLRLRGGMPTKEPAAFTPSALNQYPVIPCCTILLQLLPHTQFSVLAPSYLMGYYFSNDAKPSNSELEVISSFQKDNSFPKLVQDMAIHLIDKEQSKVTLDHLKAWYVERLDEKRHSQPEHFPKYINIHHAVRYRQEAGIRIKVKQAFGLKAGGYYVNVFARVLRGAASMHFPELPQQWAGEEKFLTSQLDFTSLQRSPQWTDPSVVLHPYLDDNSVLLIQIFCLSAIYVPDPSGQRPGKVISHPGQILELNTQSQLGWTAVPLFDSNYVRSGVHSAPLFQGSPSAEFLQSVISQPVKDVMAEGNSPLECRLWSSM
ncbi:unnamed protein product, partial [Natator depressus]